MSRIWDRAMQLFDGAATLAQGTYYTDVIPLKKLGLNINESYIHAQVTTAFTSGGAATVTFTLEKDTTSAFASPTAVKATSALSMATLADNYDIFYEHLTDLAYQESSGDTYLRIKYVVATADLTAGNFKAGVTLGKPINNRG